MCCYTLSKCSQNAVVEQGEERCAHKLHCSNAMVLYAVLNQVLRAEHSSKVEGTTEEYMGDAETMGRPAGL